MKRSLLWQLPLLAMLFGCVGPCAKSEAQRMQEEYESAQTKANTAENDLISTSKKHNSKEAHDNLLSLINSYNKTGMDFDTLDLLFNASKPSQANEVRFAYKVWKQAKIYALNKKRL
jgi:hypothetical protein